MWTTARFHAAAAASALLLLLAPSAASAASAASAHRVNGWFPCAFSTATDPSYGSSLEDSAVFECAEIEVPLCYAGVCDSDRLIDVFVKRRLAQKPPKDASQRKAMIMIQGGPGYASPVMESLMESLLDRLDHSADFYTFDHRGTGRSEYLMCNAAQALTAGSPGGTALSLDELQSCFQDLNFQYDGQAAAFSTTSAAMDVRAMIETFMADQEVFVLGYSYGTYLTQRILQLQIPQIKGYVFESVDVLSTHSDPLESSNSHWNKDMEFPTRRLLEYCYDDERCLFQFKSRETVLKDVLAFYAQLDQHKDTNICAQVVMDATGWTEPSAGLRNWAFERVGNPTDRVLALAALSHVQRCSKDDVIALRSIMVDYSRRLKETTRKKAVHMRSDNVPDPLDDSSPLLYDLIVSSERWSQPSPTQAEREQFYSSGVFTADDTDQARLYCVYTGSPDQACIEFENDLPAGNQTFFYKRDKYASMPLVLPNHATALILNGGLDFATPLEFGELLYDKLSGSGGGLMMVNFDFGVHCGGEAVAESPDTPCHDSIIAQFIAKSGAVDKINTNCMASLPKTGFHN